jgi:hypothetical protein
MKFYINKIIKLLLKLYKNTYIIKIKKANWSENSLFTT